MVKEKWWDLRLGFSVFLVFGEWVLLYSVRSLGDLEVNFIKMGNENVIDYFLF